MNHCYGSRHFGHLAPDTNKKTSPPAGAGSPLFFLVSWFMVKRIQAALKSGGVVEIDFECFLTNAFGIL